MLPPDSMLTIKKQVNRNTKIFDSEFEASISDQPPAPLESGSAVSRRNALLTRRLSFFLFGLLLILGCTPAGPRALLEGKRLIDQGKYPRAVEKMRNATSLLGTNAQAWNYLGLACHYAGLGDEAERAYKRALTLNMDLT